MAFFDKLNEFTKNLGEMTNDAIETSKLNSKVNAEKTAAGEELKKIGEYYYGIYTSEGVVAPEVLEFCEAAKAHFDAATEAQAEIDRIKVEAEAAKAEKEAAAQAAQAAAAASMQTAQTMTAETSPAGERICANCGNLNPAGTKFCGGCGSKLEVPEAPVKRFCTGCGAEIKDGLKFCGECGTRIE
ncbi:MAG: zinc ribbon domain-containing protein [Lachnospiraceae bacterium]|nr:zinc ribbon domain-containing protein [Lachnospiraceae bacterium]